MATAAAAPVQQTWVVRLKGMSTTPYIARHGTSTINVWVIFR